MYSLLAQIFAISNTFTSPSLKLSNLKLVSFKVTLWLGQSNAMRYNGLNIGVGKMKNGLFVQKTKGCETFVISLKFY